MRRNWLIAVIVLFLILTTPLLLRKNAALLGSSGGKIAVATRSIVPSLDNGAVDVCVEDEKVFSLWEDWCDGPLFIYPFVDGRRFLCDYNYDTAILVFVVDLDTTHTNLQKQAEWPADRELRANLASSATNACTQSKGIIRLASAAELQEVRDYLLLAAASRIRTASFPYCDFGFYHDFAEKDFLLLSLATNRQSWAGGECALVHSPALSISRALPTKTANAMCAPRPTFSSGTSVSGSKNST